MTTRASSVIEAIPTGVRVFAAVALQVLALVYLVVQHLVLGSLFGVTSGGLSLRFLSVYIYGQGGPPFILYFMLAGLLLAWRTRVHVPLGVVTMVVIALAGVEQVIGMVGSTSAVLRLPDMPATGGYSLVQLLTTLAYTVVALVMAAGFVQTARSRSTAYTPEPGIGAQPITEMGDPVM